MEEIKTIKLSDLIFELCGVKKAPSNILKEAGRKLKKSENLCREFLLSKKENILAYQKNGDSVKAPVKCNIIAKSQNFDKWSILETSSNIQKYIYSLSKDEFETITPKLLKAKLNELLDILNSNNVKCPFQKKQALDLIVKHSIETYKGVITKVNNKNEKNKEYCLTHNKEFIPENPFNENNKLVNPPGVNLNIYCIQKSATTIKKDKDANFLNKLEYPLCLYNKNPKELIPVLCNAKERVNILPNHPGFIPHFQKSSVNVKKNRLKLSKSLKDQHALLIKIFLDENQWVIVDARGLLRNVYWRKLATPGTISLDKLLSYFTEYPIIDPKRNIAVFQYREGVLPVYTKKTINYSKAPKIFSEKKDFSLISVDVGVNNPIAARISVFKNFNENPSVIKSETFILPKQKLDYIAAYKTKYTEFNSLIKQNAIDNLSDEQKLEVSDVKNSELNKNYICEQFGLDKTTLPWNSMSNGTYYLSDAVIASGNNLDKAYFQDEQKLNDSKFCKQYGKKLSKETNSKLQKNIWELQKNSKEYQKFTVTKKQISNEITNYILNVAKKNHNLQNENLIVNIEKLVKRNGFFDGNGFRDKGWDNFFKDKAENRWFMNAIHKSLENLAQDKGICVIESAPHRTSITCTNCNYCDSQNRKGEKFKCIKCNYEANADIDIATKNLEKVALTGKALPKIEQQGDEKKPRTARKQSKRKKLQEIVAAIQDNK